MFSQELFTSLLLFQKVKINIFMNFKLVKFSNYHLLLVIKDEAKLVNKS